MNYYISKILREKTITSYLEEKGIFPQKRTGDKYLYHCPIHSGDNSPSFTVYPVGHKGRDYQTYYCFACHSGISVINLKSDLENISTKESVKYFIKNTNIDNSDVRKSIIEDFKRKKLGIEENKGVEFLMLLINTTCRRHIIEECENDEEERIFFEKLFFKMDKIARARNVDLLEGIFDIIVRGNEKRSINYKKKKEENVDNSFNWKI